MIESARYVEVVETPSFERASKRLFDEDQLMELAWKVAQRPDAGAVMPRTGGFRKLRFALEGHGKRVKVAEPPHYSAARICRLRITMGLSQAVFADALNVSRETVRAWEQDKRRPTGATLRLLEVAERHPEVILDSVKLKEGE